MGGFHTQTKREIMAEKEDETFESTDAGASLTTPSEAGQVKKGGYLLIKEKPCKVVDIKVSKTGKHGHAKCVFTGLDIFTDKKYEMMSPSTHTVSVPVVKRTQWTIIDMEDDDGVASLMDDNGETKDDLNVPESLREEVRKLLDEDGDALVDVLVSMDHEQIMSVKRTAA